VKYDENPTTAEGWVKLADAHVEYANRERLGHLQTAARLTARRARQKADELRAGGEPIGRLAELEDGAL
jgi:hypothetical protein